MNAFDVMEGLLILEQNNKNIGEFFRDNNVDSIVLYGFGRIGVRAYEAIERAGVRTECIVDKAADRISFGNIRIITPGELKKNKIESELIVVTPMEYYYDIKEDLETYTDTDVISIGEIVEYCMEGEDFQRMECNKNNMNKRRQKTGNVLLIGGTGILSSAVAKAAKEDGWNVYILTRGTSWREGTIHVEAEKLIGDIRDAKNIRKLISGIEFDVVVDFISFTPDHLRNKLLIFEGHYKQYIFVSSVGAYDVRDTSIVIKENNTIVGNNGYPYGWNKALCECYLQEYFKRRDEAYSIIRPGFIYNNLCIPYFFTDGFTMRSYVFLDRIEQGKGIITIDQGRVLTTIMHSDDFAKAFVKTFMNEKAFREDFHITNDKGVSWREVLNCIERQMNIKIETKDISKEQLETYCPEYLNQIRAGSSSMKFCNDKLRGIYPQFDCKKSLDEGIKETIDFYKTHKKYLKVQSDWAEEEKNWGKKMDLLSDDRRSVYL